MYNIPLSVPSFNGNEWKYIKDCIDTEWVSSVGKYVDLFEKNISEYSGAKYAVACVNGTAALQISLQLAGVSNDDEVIVPTLTFIAPINSIIYNSAKPIFMDSDSYYNLNTEKTVDFIKNQTIFKNGFTYNKKTNKKIAAILLVHIWGNACLFDELFELCEKQNINILEDASEALGTFYNNKQFQNKHAGTVGKLGCISFNGNKIITTGGGGIILSNDKKLAEKAKYLTTQAKDDPLRYIHNEVGYNYRLTNIQAALGVAQLEQLPKILKRKKEIYDFYKSSVENISGLTISRVPAYANNNHWMNILIINKNYKYNCESLMKKLLTKGISSRPVWQLNHLQKPYLNCQSYKIENANNQISNSLCIPSSTNLTNEDLNNIIKELH